jgi:hypothetical protein
MKQRITFTFIMGIITTGTISFALVGLNFGFGTGFLGVWFRSWAVSYPLAVMLIYFVGPKVQAFASFITERTAVNVKKMGHDE